jgi:hypothetical protein
MAGMPEMQEHFPAGAWMARHPQNETPKMQDAIFGGLPR